MKVSLTLKDGKIEEYKNIWEIQSNSIGDAREASLVGYDHIVWARFPTKDIKNIQVEFEK